MTLESLDIAQDIAREVEERFLRYVQIDTQSQDGVERYPSTEKQLVLLRLLADELRALGAAEVTMDEHGYVMATVSSTLPPNHPRAGQVPVIGFLAHVDTSPEVSGAGVKPQVWRNYQGGDIVLPGDPRQVIRPEETPELAQCTGHDIITSDGTTLLGADDKAGVAEIMTAVAYLLRHPEIPHGTIRVAFTPDEEVGRGVDFFDVARFGARYAYTMDGSTAGEVEDETFCADTAIVTFRGRAVHPGYAKGKMVNSIRLAGDFLARLPREGMSPETTEGREGYLHPYVLHGGVEQTVIRILVRDFTVEGLREKEDLLRRLAGEVAAQDPRAGVEVQIQESYRNMKYILDQHPQVVAYAEEAVRRAGLEPIRRPIRGGTDGARLCYMGLPTANLFAGGHNFHSQREWVSVQDMAKAVETIVHLAVIWAEKGGET